MLSAIVFVAASALAVGFQIALALGAPWGAYAMGGASPGRLPSRLRVAAFVQAVVVAALAVVVLSDAGLVVPNLADELPWLIWIPVAFSAVATVFNAITRSTGERRIWLPVAIVMLVSSLLVALA